MSEITLTINGKEAAGQRGDTILQVCERHGVTVPTLCHYPGMHDIGTCRMCTVELQGGARLTTACTTPAEQGMQITTESPRLTGLRRSTLELLFSERNHYCMFCEASGDCELQQLAYKYGMDSVRYPALYPVMALDTSHPYLAFDHNRCILCRRCVRACSDLVGNSTLATRDRGIETLVLADGGEPLGDSSCVSCGVCVQVCPTGALFDKRSAYRGRLEECTVVKSACAECSLGCEVELVTRANQVLRVDGDFDSRVNGGLLCAKGRFESLKNGRERVTTPLVRRDGALQPAEWTDALAAIRGGLQGAAKQYGAGAVAGVASSRAGNEALSALKALFFHGLDSHNVGALDGVILPEGVAGAALPDLLDADVIVLAGMGAPSGHQVLEFFLARALEKGVASLVVIGSAPKRLLRRAKMHVPAAAAEIPAILKGMGEPGQPAGALLAAAQRPAVILDASAGPDAAALSAACTALAAAATSAQEGWPRLMLLGAKANSVGAGRAGMVGNGLDLKAARAAFVLMADDAGPVPAEMPGREALQFLAVQAAYRSPLTDAADVVLPAPLWTEKWATMVNAQGQAVALRPAVQAPAGIRDEASVLRALGR